MERNRLKLIILTLLVALVAAACSQADDSGQAMDSPDMVEADDGVPAFGDDAERQAETSDAQESADQTPGEGW